MSLLFSLVFVLFGDWLCLGLFVELWIFLGFWFSCGVDII